MNLYKNHYESLNRKWINCKYIKVLVLEINVNWIVWLKKIWFIAFGVPQGSKDYHWENKDSIKSCSYQGLGNKPAVSPLKIFCMSYSYNLKLPLVTVLYVNNNFTFHYWIWVYKLKVKRQGKKTRLKSMGFWNIMTSQSIIC